VTGLSSLEAIHLPSSRLRAPRLIQEWQKYAPKVTIAFEVKYVKSLPKIPSATIAKFNGQVWQVMAETMEQ
jgi:hypothetical protein